MLKLPVLAIIARTPPQRLSVMLSTTLPLCKMFIDRTNIYILTAEYFVSLAWKVPLSTGFKRIERVSLRTESFCLIPCPKQQHDFKR
jgi:hypothetical protein